MYNIYWCIDITCPDLYPKTSIVLFMLNYLCFIPSSGGSPIVVQTSESVESGNILQDISLSSQIIYGHFRIRSTKAINMKTIIR